MNHKLLLIVGVFGAGKTSVIQALTQEAHFESIPIYTTRPPRAQDHGRISVTGQEFDKMHTQGHFFYRERLLTTEYGYAHAPVNASFQAGRIPILEYTPSHTDELLTYTPWPTYVVSLFPPSEKHLSDRLQRRGFGNDAERIGFAIQELRDHRGGRYRFTPDLEIINAQGELEEVVDQIKRAYFQSIGR